MSKNLAEDSKKYKWGAKKLSMMVRAESSCLCSTVHAFCISGCLLTACASCHDMYLVS